MKTTESRKIETVKNELRKKLNGIWEKLKRISYGPIYIYIYIYILQNEILALRLTELNKW